MPKLRRRNFGTFRSGLEEDVKEQLEAAGVSYKYESEKIHYTVPAKDCKYTPDFIINTSSGGKIYIETKGIWDYEDRYKHLLIRQQHPELDIRFVFQRSKAKISKGSKTTYADICNGLGRAPFKDVKWKYADKHIPLEWIRE